MVHLLSSQVNHSESNLGDIYLRDTLVIVQITSKSLTNHCSKLLLMTNLFFFKGVLLTFPVAHIHFFLSSDMCMLDSNDSTKFLESLLSLDSK
jgi:hypothetical protein